MWCLFNLYQNQSKAASSPCSVRGYSYVSFMVDVTLEQDFLCNFGLCLSVFVPADLRTLLPVGTGSTDRSYSGLNFEAVCTKPQKSIKSTRLCQNISLQTFIYFLLLHLLQEQFTFSYIAVPFIRHTDPPKNQAFFLWFSSVSCC